MHGRNIGKGLTILDRFWFGCDEDEDFGRAMGAPMGELRPIIDRSQARGLRRVKRRIKAVTGLSWRLFCREVERRTSGRYVHFSTNIGREHSLQRNH